MATYTFDVFSTLDGYGSSEVWPGYWGKEGPELVADREKVFSPDRILVLGATGRDPIWAGAQDFDLELIESRTFDGKTQKLIYVPTLHLS